MQCHMFLISVIPQFIVHKVNICKLLLFIQKLYIEIFLLW
nr:MAG TPA: hypothetical protein [Bacteriophage sp.]